MTGNSPKLSSTMTNVLGSINTHGTARTTYFHPATLKALQARGFVRVFQNGNVRLTAAGKQAVASFV